jgi:hypothetical protein
MTRHPLDRDSQSRNTPKPAPKPTYFQVYTDEIGSIYRHNPACMTHDRAEAERVASKVGGAVIICAGSLT